jgi:SAM-dependent methyltransferase
VSGRAGEHPGTPDTPGTNAAVWKSGEGVAHFVAMARSHEQRFAAARRLMAELLPFAEEDSFTFADLGAGTGAAARAVLERYPRARAVLADFSAEMMAEGERELAAFAGRYRYVEFDLAGGAWPDGLPDPAAAVISSLCVHHLPDGRKRQLFGEIFARLAPGGWYLNFDPVDAGDPVVAETWQRVSDLRDPEAAAKRAHRSPQDQLRWENHVRYLIPLAPQVEFLRAAGFEAVDVYWKELDYVIYGGRRPPAASGQAR